MICKLCLLPMKQDYSAKGYCSVCNIFIQTLDMQEAFMIETGELKRLQEYLEVRVEIIKSKVIALRGEYA